MPGRGIASTNPTLEVQAVFIGYQYARSHDLFVLGRGMVN